MFLLGLHLFQFQTRRCQQLPVAKEYVIVPLPPTLAKSATFVSAAKVPSSVVTGVIVTADIPTFAFTITASL